MFFLLCSVGSHVHLALANKCSYARTSAMLLHKQDEAHARSLHCGRWPFLTSDDFFIRPTGHRPLTSQLEQCVKRKSQVSEAKRTKSHGNICFLVSLRAQRAPLAAMCRHGHLHVGHNKLLSLSQTDRQTDRQARLQASQNNKPEKL